MSDEKVAELAAEWSMLEARRAQIVERQSAIRADLLNLLPNGSTDAGGVKVTITTPHSFHSDVAAQVIGDLFAAGKLSADDVAAIVIPKTIQTVDKKAAQERLTGSDFGRCFVEGSRRVSIR